MSDSDAVKVINATPFDVKELQATLLAATKPNDFFALKVWRGTCYCEKIEDEIAYLIRRTEDALYVMGAVRDGALDLDDPEALELKEMLRDVCDSEHPFVGVQPPGITEVTWWFLPSMFEKPQKLEAVA